MSYGRTKIYSDAKEITAANVVEDVSNAYSLHCRNPAEIKSLWDCYRGKTKILQLFIAFNMYSKKSGEPRFTA